MNAYGHHDAKEPYKDKSHLLNEDINHPRWLKPGPGIRSRSELQQARFAGRAPDPRSYDLDGDGVVGQKDFYAARIFDSDLDGCLTAEERSQVREEISRGFFDRQVHGLENAHDKNNLVTQKRGVIWNNDNAAEAAQAGYRPHHNASQVPKHSTKTALLLDRAAELKNLAVPFGERYAAAKELVREPQPSNAQTEPRTCPIAHIRERAEGDHQAARVRAGLLPVSMHTNLARESRTVGMDYVEEPFIATRSQLLETRKELMKCECEELRAKGDELFPPLSVRDGEKEVEEYNFRRAPQLPAEAEPMTLTKLKDDRRVQRIEHNMRNFSHEQPASYPRFADHPEVPFWGGAKPSTAPASMSRIVSEPVLKVTETPWKAENEVNGGRHLPDGAYATCEAAGLAARGRIQTTNEKSMGSHTVKRWSSDLIAHGQGKNKPRMFDNIPVVPVGPRDMEPLDVTSAMEPLRNAALLKQAEDRTQNAMNPPRSKLDARQSKILPGNRSVEALSASAGNGASKNSQDHDGFSRRTSITMQFTAGHTQIAPGRTLGRVSELSLRRPGELVQVVQRPRSEQSAVRCSGFQRVDEDLQKRTASKLGASSRHSTVVGAAATMGTRREQAASSRRPGGDNEDDE